MYSSSLLQTLAEFSQEDSILFRPLFDLSYHPVIHSSQACSLIIPCLLCRVSAVTFSRGG